MQPFLNIPCDQEEIGSLRSFRCPLILSVPPFAAYPSIKPAMIVGNILKKAKEIEESLTEELKNSSRSNTPTGQIEQQEEEISTQQPIDSSLNSQVLFPIQDTQCDNY